MQRSRLVHARSPSWPHSRTQPSRRPIIAVRATDLSALRHSALRPSYTNPVSMQLASIDGAVAFVNLDINGW